MEAKSLARVLAFLSIFVAIYAQSNVNYISNVADDDDSGQYELETAIYYGDSEVFLGKPFAITCIIPITNPISWLKDGEPIKHHNLRHGRDEHSYNITESPIEGEKHKIEAHISVRHALNVHAGKYQCNNLHTTYHMLHVLTPLDDGLAKPQTKSPFIITAGDDQLSTESVYEPIYELTPNAPETYTRTWDPAVLPELPAPGPLPTQTATTHHRPHHHHHQQQQEPHQQREGMIQHKFIYKNATNYDGSPRAPAPPPPLFGESNENIGLVNLGYIPPTPKHNEFTTNPWRNAGTAFGYERAGDATTTTTNVHSRNRSKVPPQFPPPRMAPATAISPTITMMAPTASHPTPPPMYMFYTQQPPYRMDNYHHMENSNPHATGTHGHGHDHGHSVQPQTPRFHQTTYYQQQPTAMVTVPWPSSSPSSSNAVSPQVPNLNPPYQQQYNQMQTHPSQVQQFVPNVPMISPATTAAAAASSLTPTVGQYAIVPTKPTTPISKETEFLVPNYDRPEIQMKAYEIKSALVLSCNITKEGDFTLTWEKNGTDVTKVKELEGRYQIIPAERKFIIERTNAYDDGRYSCVANNQRRDINVVAKVVVHVVSNTGVVEGEKLSITCSVLGTDPKLSWAVGNMTYTSTTGRYILKADDNEVENAILIVENVTLDDAGRYICIGSNAASEYGIFDKASDDSIVRVKDKLAALWPFLGICAEVLVLCTIILIYEKRRNKSELEESDTDPQEQKKKRRNYN